MLYQNANATRADLADAPIPTRLPYHQEGKQYQWEPIPHIDLLDGLYCALENRGYSVTDEKLALCKNGFGLIGSLDLDAPADLKWAEDLLPGGLTPSMGFRHSNDGKWSASIAVGARVIVCSNGMIEGTHVLRKQHRGLDVYALAKEAVATWEAGAEKLGKRLQAFNEVSIPNAMGDALLVAGAHRGVFPWRFIGYASAEWHHPRHAENSQRNLWGWLNACTEAVKRREPQRQWEGLERLQAFAHLIADQGAKSALRIPTPSEN
jgi:hypothetical protein